MGRVFFYFLCIICVLCMFISAEPTRNLALEKVLKNYNVKLPCKYSSNGCTEKRACEEKEAHQLVCPFKTYTCPMSNNNNCRWEGHLDEIVDHLKGRRRPSHFVPLLYGRGFVLKCVIFMHLYVLMHFSYG